MQAKSEAYEGTKEARQVAERRRFIATCSKFAVVMPPAVTLLLSVTQPAHAGAAAGAFSDPQTHRAPQP